MLCTICASDKTTDCIIECLEKIKLHYSALKKELCEKDAKIQELQASKNLKKISSPNKRRKSSCEGFNDNDQENPSDIFGNGNALLDMSSEDLNFAFNSQNDFDCLSPVSTKSKEKQISEIEKSPQVFKQIKSDKKMKNRNDANAKPTKAESTSGWISKEKENRESNVNVLKPNNFTKDNCFKKFNLSLKTPNTKLKQTRLQVDRVQVDAMPLNDTTFCDEVISPSLKKETTTKKVTMKQLRLRLQNNTKNKKIINADDAVFDFLRDESIDKSSLPENHMQFPDKSIRISKNEEIPPLFENEDVIFLTPPKQPVLQINESIDSDSPCLETMDLLKSINTVDSERQIRALKRLESKSIQEMQKKSGGSHTQQERKKQSDPFDKKKNSIFSLNQNIKLENPFMETNENVFVEESDNDDLIAPIAEQAVNIKNEPSSPDPILADNNEKRNFDVDCDHCRQYMRFLANNRPGGQVDEHLWNCIRHKDRDIYVQPTPEGFWNPHMVSFDEDDPRNETLVDTRFIGKTRRK